ncbi:hypothetical protein JEQ17_47595 [Streptomyces liliifuscus]|uniref:Uncharacterized protein n=1 Tax=Streptomyces liliifuscus TaxID=2797636 RepID=A0A7T7L4R3_9ACTN|nr:hypothetical protein [Streptomyces liliifuscus]QQM46324.1 hypothetical protein JEQ17_47595 [Streptomyces liliifuscus]
MWVNIASAAPPGSWAPMRSYTRQWPRLEATRMSRSGRPMYGAASTTWLSSAGTTPWAMLFPDACMMTSRRATQLARRGR